MYNNSDLPEGWAMPDSMAKRVSDGVNKKPLSPEDKVQSALDKMARDISLIEPNPKDWSWWVTYLLEKLEAEAERRGMRDIYKPMLRSLKQDLGNRISLG